MQGSINYNSVATIDGDTIKVYNGTLFSCLTWDALQFKGDGSTNCVISSTTSGDLKTGNFDMQDSRIRDSTGSYGAQGQILSLNEYSRPLWINSAVSSVGGLIMEGSNNITLGTGAVAPLSTGTQLGSVITATVTSTANWTSGAKMLGLNLPAGVWLVSFLVMSNTANTGPAGYINSGYTGANYGFTSIANGGQWVSSVTYVVTSTSAVAATTCYISTIGGTYNISANSYHTAVRIA